MSAIARYVVDAVVLGHRSRANWPAATGSPVAGSTSSSIDFAKVATPL